MGRSTQHSKEIRSLNTPADPMTVFLSETSRSEGKQPEKTIGRMTRGIDCSSISVSIRLGASVRTLTFGAGPRVVTNCKSFSRSVK